MSNQVHVIDVINSRSGNSNNTITSSTKSWHKAVSTQSLSYFRTQIYQDRGQKVAVIEELINWGLVFITPAGGKNYGSRVVFIFTQKSLGSVEVCC